MLGVSCREQPHLPRDGHVVDRAAVPGPEAEAVVGRTLARTVEGASGGADSAARRRQQHQHQQRRRTSKRHGRTHSRDGRDDETGRTGGNRFARRKLYRHGAKLKDKQNNADRGRVRYNSVHLGYNIYACLNNDVSGAGLCHKPVVNLNHLRSQKFQLF